MMCGEKWLETGNPFTEGDMSESQIEWYKTENARLTKQVEQLMKDVHRIDSARQSAVSQCAAMAERIDELESVVCGGAIGERGDACMSVDGGNL
jgi:outer membrane murein-binding lipoprotein Lpp